MGYGLIVSTKEVPRGAHPNRRITSAAGNSPVLSPSRAWQILHRRTGGQLSRSTFYRWLESGKVYSLRLGARLYVPWQELESIIKKCVNGEPL